MPAGANPAKKSSKPKTKKIIKLETQPNEAKKQRPLFDPEDVVFALDIGTRTVVGVVGCQEKDKFKVLAAESIEHKNRAMMDGQIHDIEQVANIAAEVKERLEKKLGISLTRVAIAAAGRVLKTCEVRVDREIEDGREIDKQLVGSLEMEGIQQAQYKLDQEVSKEEKTQFYCVGYSVINYYLNGYVISSLVGHRGRRIGIEVLATFLPHIVVDSLYTVMSKIGLEVSSLTLEPIAAINVTIPKDLRMLNLALVDIGAGTSDIALTRDGSVVAYAMAPIAGDEITEKIAQHYLLDFNTSERLKISLSSGAENAAFTDILGIKHVVGATEIIEVIKPAVESLAETIANKILDFNHKAPNAVFLIGGGSQIPGLTEQVAENLKLPKDRVVVRGREVIQNIKFSGKKLTGPEAITPFGIAVTAQIQQGQDFLSVTLNGKKLRLFNSRKLTISDALVLVGFNPGQLIGRSGKSISFTFNGEQRTVRGEPGKPAEIYVNGNPASLATVLTPGDDIRVKPAEDGAAARVLLSQMVKDRAAGSITFNNSKIEIGTLVSVNGGQAAGEREILEGDVIETRQIKTVEDLIRVSEVDTGAYDIFVNGSEAEGQYVLRDSDVVKLLPKADVSKTREEQQEEVPQALPAAGEGEAPGFCVIVNGKAIEIKGEKKQYIFIDIFNYIDFDLTRPQGNIVLRHNGAPAGFTDEIRHGDVIEIYWER